MVWTHALLFFVAFFTIWFGSGLIISSTSHFSKKLRLSPFAFSFVFLGILTSIPEFSVGMQSIAHGDPEIFVGNLLGGVILLFLLVIPLLAIFGNGINMKHELDKFSLLITLTTIAAPAFFILDQKVTNIEGVILVALYIIQLFFAQRKKGIFDHENSDILNLKAYSFKDLMKVSLGIGTVFVASNLIVNQTAFFADYFAISGFYIGLLIIALGTNLPELSLSIRSILSGKKDVAMGDYIGSASANTLLFGVFTLLNHGEVLTINNFFMTFLFTLYAVGMVYALFLTRQRISRVNGIIMLGIYVLFVFVELYKI